MKKPNLPRGFTMIELVVVMAVLGLLLSIAMPRYLASLERGREQVLSHNLAQLREAIDRFYGDRGAYPERLEDLVEQPGGPEEIERAMAGDSGPLDETEARRAFDRIMGSEEEEDRAA